MMDFEKILTTGTNAERRQAANTVPADDEFLMEMVLNDELFYIRQIGAIRMHPALTRLFKIALRDEHWQVRQVAAKRIPEDNEELMEIAERDRHPEVRRAALRLLMNAGSRVFDDRLASGDLVAQGVWLVDSLTRIRHTIREKTRRNGELTIIVEESYFVEVPGKFYTEDDVPLEGERRLNILTLRENAADSYRQEADADGKPIGEKVPINEREHLGLWYWSIRD